MRQLPSWAVVILLSTLAACQSRTSGPGFGGSATGSSARSPQGDHVPHTVNSPGRLRLAAAADLRFALPELTAAFHKSCPDIAVEPTFGASGSLVAQIANGLPVDIFLSADESYPKQLVQHGLAEAGDLFRYARGHLVLWVPADSPRPVEWAGITLLTQHHLRRLAIANPRTAPYGQAALALLEKLQLAEAYRDRLLLADNVVQALQFAQSGNADAALISKSLALGGPADKAGRWFEIPPHLYPPIIQAGVILRQASDRHAAEQWRDFLLSPSGQKILARYGFTSPHLEPMSSGSSAHREKAR